jgi:hypothetical protein
MKKTTIHQFDPIIYPFKLWVACTDNYEALNSRFCSLDDSDLSKSTILDHEAVCFYVRERRAKGNYGCLVVFTKREYFTIKNMAHEAAHVSDYLWEHLKEDKVTSEANAYFMGWIVDSMYKVKTNKFDV